MTKTFVFMDDHKLRYSILQTDKNEEELKMLYEADEIREMESIEQAREHGKGYEYIDASGFYK